MKHKWIIGVIIILIICAVIALSSVNVIEVSDGNSTNTSGVTLKITAQGAWQADITDGNGYDTIFNEGNATYDLNDNSTVSVTIAKQGNDNGIIEAQLIKDGKVMSNQTTDAPYGTVTVKMA